MPTNDNSEKVTIYDVAEHAGVAISTVSRVLNDSRDVSDTTRSKVMAAIDELQFRPNRTAKTLAQRTTRTLAVAVPTFTTPFHNELLKGIRSQLGNVDVDLLLCDLAWAAPEATLMNFLNRGAMDGLLLAGLPVSDDVSKELQKLGAPVVLIGSQRPEFDSFYWDDRQGGRLAVNHLIERGHERIGMITTHMESTLRNARVQGYKMALRDADLPVRDDFIVTGRTEKHAGFSEESGYEAMEALLDLQDPPTAVFASSDVQAIGAWQAMRHHGLDAPDDIALVGYDDIKVSRFIGLSSIAQNMHDVGEQATDMLLRRINGGGSDDAISNLVEPELIIRTSS